MWYIYLNVWDFKIQLFSINLSVLFECVCVCESHMSDIEYHTHAHTHMLQLCIYAGYV